MLTVDQWRPRAERHEQRIGDFLAGYREDAPHPVWDFLFTYYSVRPGHLRCWHPGYGVVLAGAEAVARYRGRTGYVQCEQGMTVSEDHLAKRIVTVRFVAELLAATAARPAQLNCFGMHEWAMVYRSTHVRHQAVPLRLGGEGTDAVVESMPLRCSHFDAFRFFTPEAVPRNAAQLTRDTQLQTEQPGCLHANMDLAKWALKLGPLLESGLLADCLDLAATARELDMRASPYDLGAYGLTPIRVELPDGRAEYARRQADIAARAAALRAALLASCRHLAADSKRFTGVG
ncbi:MAG TPA: 3-methyladenine DNA glycosylase [Mycobacterium sp.]|nr:3-methyladenine DNA glycosylase [Mycobacterium sp.]